MAEQLLLGTWIVNISAGKMKALHILLIQDNNEAA